MFGKYSPRHAYIVAGIGGLLAIAGAIVAFVFSYPLYFGLIGLILGGLCLIMEIPMVRVHSFKHPLIRSLWYFMSGVVLVVLGIFAVNPLLGLFIAAGAMHLIGSFLYLLTRFHRI